MPLWIFQEQILPDWSLFYWVMSLVDHVNAVDKKCRDFSKAFYKVSHDILVNKPVKCVLDITIFRSTAGWWTVSRIHQWHFISLIHCKFFLNALSGATST